ncbi:MAG: PEP-CTERM sorting domain-containing protein [Planctomycetota bacterium]
MKRYMGVFVMLGCVACASGSTLFTYDSLSIGASAGEIQDYMEGIAGIATELTGGTNQPYVNNIGPLGDEYGPYVYTAGENMGWVEFRFEEPLQSCEFHWAVLNGSLRVYADDHQFLVTDPVRDAWDRRNHPTRFGGYDSSFHRLRFEGVWGEGQSGAIGVDNLIIQVVPEPAAMGLLAMGGVALIRRRRTA